jgi:hypothetical protein
VWKGDGNANAGHFCVTSTRFLFHGANRTNCGTARRVAFRRMETGGSADYTLRLGQGRQDPRIIVEGEILAQQRAERDQQIYWILYVRTRKRLIDR